MNKKKLSHSNLNSSITSVLAALLCIVIGMAVGFLVLLAINPAHAWGDGFVRIIKGGFIQSDKVREYSDKLIAQYDVRSGQGSSTIVRSMSGGNQQKAIIAREIDRDPKLLIAVQPTRGLDVGAIEYIHSQIVAERDRGKAVLLVSLELDEVMNLSDRILVMYEGEIVGEFDPKTTTVQELGLYMAGARKQGKESK